MFVRDPVSLFMDCGIARMFIRSLSFDQLHNNYNEKPDLLII